MTPYNSEEKYNTIYHKTKQKYHAEKIPGV